jgi:hypothetical protein
LRLLSFRAIDLMRLTQKTGKVSGDPEGHVPSYRRRLERVKWQAEGNESQVKFLEVAAGPARKLR